MAETMKPEVLKGYLILSILEASGKNKDDNYVWDYERFEGWIKVELRGGPRNVKAETKRVPVVGTSIDWRQDLSLEVLNGANELRLMLCKEKIVGTKRGVSVIAACGIFVNDIIQNVPIDKYFELFKPNAGGEGGFIRIGIDFKTSANGASTAPPGAESVARPEAVVQKSFEPQLSFMQREASNGEAATATIQAEMGLSHDQAQEVAKRVVDFEGEAAPASKAVKSSATSSKAHQKKGGPLKLLLPVALVGAAVFLLRRK